jgi:hypothetical protein
MLNPLQIMSLVVPVMVLAVAIITNILIVNDRLMGLNVVKVKSRRKAVILLTSLAIISVTVLAQLSSVYGLN